MKISNSRGKVLHIIKRGDPLPEMSERARKKADPETLTEGGGKKS